jgi:hypothetical protein
MALHFTTLEMGGGLLGMARDNTRRIAHTEPASTMYGAATREQRLLGGDWP